MNILLARILKYLNGTLFLDDYYRFCVFFIVNYKDYDKMTLEQASEKSGISANAILSFLRYLGFHDYESFLQRYKDHKRIRLEQIEERMENLKIETYVERIKVSDDNEDFLARIDQVCQKIHDCKRVILVGALYPMSIAVEMQTDLITFDKPVLQFHSYDRDMIFGEDDYVIFISATGRAMESFMYQKKRLSLDNTTSLLITQNPTYQRKKITNDTIRVPGRFDGIIFNYQIMTIFDLLRIMYYQKYIQE